MNRDDIDIQERIEYLAKKIREKKAREPLP